MGKKYNAPDLGAANREAVEAAAETFPKLRALDAAARLGTKITYEGKTYDFSGEQPDGTFKPIGDLQIAETFARAAAAIAPELAGKQLDLAKQYGTQFAQQRRSELEALDPRKEQDENWVLVSTAHPAKFNDIAVSYTHLTLPTTPYV